VKASCNCRSIAHGVVSLEHLPLEYGRARRQLGIVKMRGMSVTEGFHDFVIRRGGLTVFPQLIAERRPDRADARAAVVSQRAGGRHADYPRAARHRRRGHANARHLSYLADAIVLFRFFEAQGQIRKAISVVKKRTGRHQTSIRELKMVPSHVYVGEPLTEFHGVLTGVPQYTGTAKPLLFDAAPRWR
jgi:hypothetical protein